MKTLVTYTSQTGNTKRLAEAIYNAIPGDKEIKTIKEVESLDDYGLTFIGYPVNSGAPAKDAKRFIGKKAEGKKIAMFVTHATPTGMAPLEDIIKKCKAVGENSDTVGFFETQGELSEKIANMLVNAPDPNMQAFGKMREKTVGKPDEIALEEARKWATDIVQKNS